MQIGLVGLGRMGMNMARRWINAKHDVVVFNRSADKVQEMAKEGAIGELDVLRAADRWQ